MSTTASACPASTKILQVFGKRWKGPPRNRYTGRRGTAILAADDGTVIYSAQRIAGYGKMVIISHSNGMKTVYAHNHKNIVKEGQKVY